MFTQLLALLPLLPLLNAAPVDKVQSRSIDKRYSGVQIVSGRDGKCLAAAPKTGSGSEVTTVDCGNSNWPHLWDINPGSGSVILHGSQLALDAGEQPGNGGALKVWQSYPGLYQQTWYLTDDNRIAITGGDQCLDEGDNGAQTWQCGTGNTHQEWHVGDGNNGGGDGGNGGGDGGNPPATGNQDNVQLHPSSDATQCLSVLNGYDNAAGVQATINKCDSLLGKANVFDIPAVGASGHLQLDGTNWCYDAGESPAAGTLLKIWDCYDGLYQQTYTTLSDGRLQLTGSNLCIEQGDRKVSSNKPFEGYSELKLNDCSSDSKQVFTVTAA